MPRHFNSCSHENQEFWEVINNTLCQNKIFSPTLGANTYATIINHHITKQFGELGRVTRASVL